MNKQAQYQAYNLASYNAPKTKQVVMLYDGMIRFLNQAIEAMEQEQIEERFNLIKRVSDIINGLQGALDFENGGDIANVLHSFYTSLDFRVLALNRSNDVEAARKIIGEIRDMRDAWAKIDAGAAGEEKPAAEVSQSPDPKDFSDISA